jgi:hydroxyquinol 1,2-dioxygenase
MREMDANTITPEVQDAWRGAPTPRMRRLLQRLVAHVHDYAREVELTPEEWLGTLQFLSGCARISDENRNEFALLSDVFGLTSLVDLLNLSPGATTSSVLGPFYVEGSPPLPLGGDLAKDNPGEVVLVSGKVTDTRGRPLRGASIDMWQADINGFYGTQDPAQSDENLRCRQDCDDEGRYWFTTVLPAPYSIPMDGPVGSLFRTTERSNWRPGHYHFIVRAPEFRSLVTEIFFSHDRYVEIDAVFGVRPELVVDVKPAAPGSALPTPLERAPVKRVDFDFALAPLREAAAPQNG